MNIILLSGGSGKRLWPLSNDIRSKQLIKIFKTADIYLYLGFLGDAFFGAEHGDKTAHNSGIYLFFRRRKF